tara:strand:+ start:68 stop:406 length:339 start_codon:yes stop_codon:yes gene_type:complete
MKKIALFIKDFKTATKVSEKLGDLNLEIQFCETDFNGAIDFSLAIIDLNESDFANNEFITKLKKDANVFIIGFVSKVVKKSHDAFKFSGCNIILSNASIIKNIERLVKEGLK